MSVLVDMRMDEACAAGERPCNVYPAAALAQGERLVAIGEVGMLVKLAAKLRVVKDAQREHQLVRNLAPSRGPTRMCVYVYVSHVFGWHTYICRHARPRHPRIHMIARCAWHTLPSMSCTPTPSKTAARSTKLPSGSAAYLAASNATPMAPSSADMSMSSTRYLFGG
jgi:hypothetical protein